MRSAQLTRDRGNRESVRTYMDLRYSGTVARPESVRQGLFGDAVDEVLEGHNGVDGTRSSSRSTGCRGPAPGAYSR
jgi:hypothetical protein